MPIFKNPPLRGKKQRRGFFKRLFQWAFWPTKGMKTSFQGWRRCGKTSLQRRDLKWNFFLIFWTILKKLCQYFFFTNNLIPRPPHVPTQAVVVVETEAALITAPASPLLPLGRRRWFSFKRRWFSFIFDLCLDTGRHWQALFFLLRWENRHLTHKSPKHTLASRVGHFRYFFDKKKWCC